MILPGAAGAAIRDGHGSINGTGALNASPQTQNAQTSGTQPGNHSAAPQVVKDGLAGSDNGPVLTGQPLHSNTDANAASPSPAGANVIPVPPAGNAPAAALPAVATAAVVAESQASRNTVPASAPAAPSNPAPTAPQVPVVAAPGPVQMAQMVSRAEQSEMRIGMNTSAFGSVEVRTTVHANDVGLVIGSEKGDLRTILSSDMPAIANTLQEQNLRLHSVNFMQGFAFSNNSSGGGNSQQQSFVPPRTPSAGEGSEPAAEDAQDSLPTAKWGSAGSGLSILA